MNGMGEYACKWTHSVKLLIVKRKKNTGEQKSIASQNVVENKKKKKMNKNENEKYVIYVLCTADSFDIATNDKYTNWQHLVVLSMVSG